MIETEIVKLYKYSIRYKPGEMDEYTVILVSDNIRDLISLIADREMIDPINGSNKWFEITDFLWVAREDGKWYHLFDINEQDLAAKFGYDVQEQYWTVLFKNDSPESVKKDINEIMDKFEDKIKELNKNENQMTYNDILGQALYESKYVQDAIRDKKKEKNLHDAIEFDAGIGTIEEIVKGKINDNN